MAIARFEQLDVWKAAHKLVLGVYKITQKFPTEERYGLVSQMRRAGVSVPANIAGDSSAGAVLTRRTSTILHRHHSRNYDTTSFSVVIWDTPFPKPGWPIRPTKLVGCFTDLCAAWKKNPTRYRRTPTLSNFF